jgi:ATP-binding cassette, subfamily A (ABC1), member 3
MFCFMLSVFFSKANTASAVTGLITFITFAPFTFLQQNSSNISLPVLLACCLLTNSAMGFGFQVIVRHEGNGNGLQWSNMFRPASIDESLSVGLVLVMMLIDACIYLLVALYVEKVFPGDFGVAEPWYFPFTTKFWCNRTQKISADDYVSSYQSSSTCEADPMDKIAGIQIKSLRKEYSNKKVAVQNLSLNMFQDQITVLLGHNGAGKTTTMSMLTGMIRPTSGTALISGKDITTDMTSVRGSLGLCPQHNILFGELTVREHIMFYARLKGLHQTKIDAEVQKYVKLLDLADKTNMRSSTLSGGMQRKLSVAVALCADSKVVFCDEPTSGMDPAARRALWDLLLHEKKGRTILLSTHFMDEADILGDRIAIMASGELKAVGTPFFLKKKLGVGYRLVCVKASECDPDNVTQLLQKHIADIEMQTNIGSELSYQLPETHISHFQTMLEDLEASTEELQLLNYGISLTTLEEVFLK